MTILKHSKKSKLHFSLDLIKFIDINLKSFIQIVFQIYLFFILFRFVFCIKFEKF